MNFGTFITFKPDIFTFRVLGFGVLMYSTHSELAPLIEPKVWAVPILPGVRFAFVAPWL